MGRSYGLVYPLWNYGGGADELLDRAVGEVGLDHLTLPVVTGPMQTFRAYATDPPKVFATNGGWHFPPAIERYAATALRPRSAHWFGKRNVLARVCEFAEQRGVAVYFRIDLGSVPALLDHAPHLVQRNAWGDQMRSYGACVCNADLRELLRETLEDLRQYQHAGIELERWTPDPQPADASMPLATLESSARGLLSVCFCASCRQIATVAGVDPDQAARSARVHVERSIARPDEDGAVEIEQDELLSAYIESRGHDTQTWLSRLVTQFGEQTYFLIRSGTRKSEDASCGLRSLVRPARAISEEELQEALGGASDVGLAHGAWWPAFRHADDLVRFVTDAQKRGATFFDFEQLDEAPPEALTWLRQAVRFARRD